MCAVPSNDTLHSYPYACRVYEPGEQKYALLWKCQSRAQNKAKGQAYPWATGINGQDSSDDEGKNYLAPYFCRAVTYDSCNPGYYLSDCDVTNADYIETPQAGNSCKPCPLPSSTEVCPGDNKCPAYTDPEDSDDDIPEECGTYVGSLYQKVVSYALQACMRPTETQNITKVQDKYGNDITPTPISTVVLQDVNTTMDSIRVSMSESLGAECERLGGYWVATQYKAKESDTAPTRGSNIKVHTRFYDETGANTKWGYCADSNEAREYYNITDEGS